MFFRREKPKEFSFAERLDGLKRMGFAIQAQGASKSIVVRGRVAGVVEAASSGQPSIRRAGWLVGNEIGELVDLGYQKEWRAPSGAREPALADQLKAVHAFMEDLREGLGITSHYNESLGTVNDAHVYDRVEGREHGRPKTVLPH